MMNQSPKLSTVESILLSSVLSSTQCTSHSWSGEKSCYWSCRVNQQIYKLLEPLFSRLAEEFVKWWKGLGEDLEEDIEANS